MPLFVRILLCAVAVVMLALAAFVYEDEQKRLQSRLVDWWVWLDDRRIKTEATEKTLVAELAAFASRILDSLFGTGLWSFRAAFASIFVALAGTTFRSLMREILAIASPAVPYEIHLFLDNSLIMLFATILSAIALIKLSRRANRVHRFTWLALSSALFGILLFGEAINLSVLRLFDEDLADEKDIENLAVLGLWRVPFTAVALLLSIASDFLVIALFRRALIHVTAKPVGLRSALILGSTVLASIALFVVPLACSLNVLDWLNADVADDLTAYNLGELLLVITVLSITCLMALNHALWHVLLRPLYALQRIEIFSHKKELCSVAIALLGIALVPAKEGWTKAILEVVKKVFGG